MDREEFAFYINRTDGKVNDARICIFWDEKKIELSDWSYVSCNGGYEDEYYLYIQFDQLKALKTMLEKKVEPSDPETFNDELKAFMQKETNEDLKQVLPYLVSFYKVHIITETLTKFCDEAGIKNTIWRDFDFS